MSLINLYNFNGFCIQEHDHSYEAKSVYLTCLFNKIPFKRIKRNEVFPDNFIPCGNIRWCENILGKIMTPDYYPNFLQSYLFRKIWKTNVWPTGKKVFIKPSDKHKRFGGFVTTGFNSKRKKPPFICSDIVKFKNEWRYYITNGKIIYSDWYCGDEINTPDPPTLNIQFPYDFSGCIDFGTIIYDKKEVLALVESQPPVSCGWYGKINNSIYTQWLIDGWNYLKK